MHYNVDMDRGSLRVACYLRGTDVGKVLKEKKVGELAQLDRGNSSSSGFIAE